MFGLGTDLTVIVELDSTSKGTLSNSTTNNSILMMMYDGRSKGITFENATEGLNVDLINSLITSSIDDNVNNLNKKYSLIDAIAHIGADGCIEVCDWKRPISYMLPALVSYAIGITALVLSIRVRSLPENFRDARSLYVLLIGLFLIILLFTPLFVVLHDPRLEFIKYTVLLQFIIYTQFFEAKHFKCFNEEFKYCSLKVAL